MKNETQQKIQRNFDGMFRLIHTDSLGTNHLTQTTTKQFFCPSGAEKRNQSPQTDKKHW